MSELLTYAVIAYALYKLLTSSFGKSLITFVKLCLGSAKSHGGRATAHNVVDGIFNGADRVRERTEGFRESAKARVPKRQDWKYDADADVLTVFISKTQDWVFEPGRRRGFEVFQVDQDGRETQLTQKHFERALRAADRRKQVSASQHQAMRDYIRKHAN